MIDGSALIGAAPSQIERRFGKTVAQPRGFSACGEAEVEAACTLAEAAFDTLRNTSCDARALFLEAVATAIEAIGDPLITHAMAETGLPRARLEGERARTTGQLRLFAEVVRRGDWQGLILDTAMPDRTPPRPDLRVRHIALGPVAVFGASNFPLAFSVAGGDTAAAFAAGCPVVVKGHPAHPATGELVARAVQQAVAACDLPEGSFSFLPGESTELGGALVRDPRIRAVGFTGSRRGGLALTAIANARAEPIPVYAEMSSINPVVLFPGALAGDVETLASGFVASLLQGVGQFCTNPGLVLGVDCDALDRFTAIAAGRIEAAPAAPMLSTDIHSAFEAGVAALRGSAHVACTARGEAGDATHGRAALLTTDAAAFLAEDMLGQEVFGPSSLIVRCEDMAQLVAVLAHLEGQLTVTLHIAPGDEAAAAPIIPLLERKAGRILVNGWPTGVEVAHAMVHGGPFPATSDGRSTSVGSLAIARFLRPVCYQSMPQSLLPAALRDDASERSTRRVDGVLHVSSGLPA